MSAIWNEAEPIARQRMVACRPAACSFRIGRSPMERPLARNGTVNGWRGWLTDWQLFRVDRLHVSEELSEFLSFPKAVPIKAQQAAVGAPIKKARTIKPPSFDFVECHVTIITASNAADEAPITDRIISPHSSANLV